MNQLLKCFREMNVSKCHGINFKSQQTSSTCMIRGWSSTRQIPSATLGLPIKYIFPRLAPPKAQSIIKVTGHYKRSRGKKIIGRLLEESFHCVQMNGVTGKTSYAKKSHFPSTTETGRRLKMYIFFFT